MPRLTDASIKAADGGTLWDENLKGFGVRVGKTKKTFIVLVSSGRRQSIGHYPLVSLADARREAKCILAEKTVGKVRPAHVAWDDAKHDYLAECAKKNKPSTLDDYTKILARHFPFERRGVGDITPREILRRLKRLDEHPTRKRYAFAVARAFFKWCVRRQHIIDRSPMENLQTPRSPQPRERVLSQQELQALCEALQPPLSTFKSITLLLLLTGQRRGEVSHLEWDWVGEDTITLPAAVTKNKRTHTFPLGPRAQQVLREMPQLDDSPYVFPAGRRVNDKTTVFNGWSKPKKALDAETGISNWILHDLRRTVSSGMAMLGVQQVVVEKLLNHVSGGTQSPIAQVYNRHAYMDEMRNAVLKWEAHLDNLNLPEGLSNPGVS